MLLLYRCYEEDGMKAFEYLSETDLMEKEDVGRYVAGRGVEKESYCSIWIYLYLHRYPSLLYAEKNKLYHHHC